MAADGTLPQDKIKERLRGIQDTRRSVEAQLSGVSAALPLSFVPKLADRPGQDRRGISIHPELPNVGLRVDARFDHARVLSY
ncbi:hypothetical protein [Nocardia sp. NPDC051463]|uniref:hypothetical protein n=1 Tax=Nocardia sp. NPDC051463 TaxID=3154845 RepID=UPI003422C56B